MRCNNIKELILTDYVDEELSGEQKAMIDVHLEGCADCRALAAEVHLLAQHPFQRNGEVNISQEAVWQKIKLEIEAERDQVSVSDRLNELFEKIKTRIVRPKPAFALATAMAVLIGVVSLAQFSGRGRSAAINVEDQVRYLASLTGSFDAIDVNFGTNIEEFLL